MPYEDKEGGGDGRDNLEANINSAYCDSDDHDTDGESSTQRPCNNMPHTTLQQHAAYNIQNTAVRCLASVLLPR